MPVKNSSIFNSDQSNWHQVRSLLRRDRVGLGLFAVLFIVMPYQTFDKFDLRWLLLAALAVFTLAWFRLPTRRRHFLLIVISVPLFFLGGEIYFRLRYLGLHGLSPASCPADMGHPLSSLPRSSSSYTGLRPGGVGRLKGRKYSINRHGFRGPDYATPKPAGVFRILLVGASVCMGSGVADEERYSALLEQMLSDQRGGRGVEIVNLSLSANRYGNQLHILENWQGVYEPDLIMFLANDFGAKGELKIEAPRIWTYRGPRWKMLVQPHFKFFSNRFFFGRMMAKAREQNFLAESNLVLSRPLRRVLGAENRVSDSPPIQWHCTTPEVVAARERVRQTYARLAAVAGEIPVLLYQIRPVVGSTDTGRLQAFRELVRQEMRHYNFHLLDLSEATYEYAEDELVVYPGDQHPNAVAQRGTARQMLPGLTAIVEDCRRGGKTRAD